jgi:hypothetical protein
VSPSRIPIVNSGWRIREHLLGGYDVVTITVTDIIKPSDDPETFEVHYIFDENDTGPCVMSLSSFLQSWEPITNGATEASTYEPPKGRSAWQRLLDD